MMESFFMYFNKEVNYAQLRGEIDNDRNIMIATIDAGCGEHGQFVEFKAELPFEQQVLVQSKILAHVPVFSDPSTESQIVNVLEIPPHALPKMVGSYFEQTFSFNASANQCVEYPISFPYDICIRGGLVEADDSYIGDMFKVEIAPKSPLGPMTRPIAKGSISLGLPNYIVKDYLWTGDVVELLDPQTGIMYYLGRVVDKTFDEVIFESPAEDNFPPQFIVLLTTEIVSCRKIRHAKQIEIGRFTQRAMYMPKGYPLVISYHSLTDKEVNFTLGWYT